MNCMHVQASGLTTRLNDTQKPGGGGGGVVCLVTKPTNQKASIAQKTFMRLRNCLGNSFIERLRFWKIFSLCLYST